MIGVSHHLRERNVVMMRSLIINEETHESHAGYLDIRVKVHQRSFAVFAVDAECQLYFLIEHNKHSHPLLLKDKTC